MPTTLLTAATDIFVIAGAAAVATAALNSKRPSFTTTLGADYDDTPLATETHNAVGVPELQQSLFQKHADDDKKTPIVSVSEVVVTPPAVEMQSADFFAGTKAA